LGGDYFASLQEHAIPLDERAVGALTDQETHRLRLTRDQLRVLDFRVLPAALRDALWFS
jgi:hypothetical protein